MKIFKDRKSAGKLLTKHLKEYKSKDNTVVLGIPRGGVVIAAEVAKCLNLPLDIIVTRKIGHPNQPELAVGAVDADGEVVWDQELLTQLKLKISGACDLAVFENLKLKIEDERDEIKRREEVYRQGRRPLDVSNKTVILTDDGIATGATILSAINYLIRHQAQKVILAVPVASKEAKNKIIKVLGEFGEVVVLETPLNFGAVGQFYHHFESVADQEVVQLLGI